MLFTTSLSLHNQPGIRSSILTAKKKYKEKKNSILCNMKKLTLKSLTKISL